MWLRRGACQEMIGWPESNRELVCFISREKFQERFKRWMDPPGIEFVSSEARARRAHPDNQDAIELKKAPARAYQPHNGTFPAAYGDLCPGSNV